MKIRTFVVDAFTDQPFKGNAAGVCLLEQPLDEASMQKIASELKHSETAFVTLAPNANGQLPIRYFTPACEIAFCGHATLASSKIILEKVGEPQVGFRTHFHLELAAEKSNDGIRMKFPLYDSTPYTPKKEMLDVLGLDEVKATRYSKDVDMLLIEVADKEALLKIQPDFKQLAKSESGIEKLAITTRSKDGEYDFYSRCFCPWLGIDEDPVTGAVHTVLAKYWGDILGKKKMKAFQASERGGYLNLEIKNEKELEVTSQAHIILEGEINL
jgi:PhzF family phenazine biosynthesis protein